MTVNAVAPRRWLLQSPPMTKLGALVGQLLARRGWTLVRADDLEPVDMEEGFRDLYARCAALHDDRIELYYALYSAVRHVVHARGAARRRRVRCLARRQLDAGCLDAGRRRGPRAQDPPLRHLLGAD